MDNLVVSAVDIAAGVNLQPPPCVEVNSEWTILPLPRMPLLRAQEQIFYLPRRVKFCIKLENTG